MKAYNYVIIKNNYPELERESTLLHNKYETIAANIMVILKRKGNEWNPLTWDEYKEERLKDGEFSEGEKQYFDKVIDYCKSTDTAALFSPKWKEIANS